MKYVELKTTEYQIFEVNDDFDYDDVEEAYLNGTLVMDHPHASYLDAQIEDDKSKFDGSYVFIC